MPIFDDPRKALRRLEQELLAEEDVPEDEDAYLTEEEWLDDEIAEAKAMLGMDEEDDEEDPMFYRNYANDYGRQTRSQSVIREDYRDVEYPEEDDEEELPVDDTRGQRMLTFVLVLGILAVAGYWVMVLL